MSALPIKGDLEGKSKYCAESDDDYESDDNVNDSVKMDEDGDVFGKSGVIFAFKDTLNFQQDKLANLVSRLDKAGKDLTILRQSSLVINNKKRFSERLFKLAHRKIAFPYEWLTNISVLQNRSPPSQSDFKSTLGIGSNIGLSEYEDFLDTWNILKEEKYGNTMTMGNYLLFYNR